MPACRSATPDAALHGADHRLDGIKASEGGFIGPYENGSSSVPRRLPLRPRHRLFITMSMRTGTIDDGIAHAAKRFGSRGALVIVALAVKGPTDTLVRGAADFVGVGLIIVLARRVTVIMNNSQITDTVLRLSSGGEGPKGLLLRATGPAGPMILGRRWSHDDLSPGPRRRGGRRFRRR
jgi:hypothetical protein